MKQLTVDRQTLESFYGDSPDDVISILTDYLNEYQATIQSFKTAYQEGLTSLKSCIHFHSSAFNYLGLPSIYSKAKELEEDCKKASSVQEINCSYNYLLALIQESGAVVKREVEFMQTAVVA